MGGFGGEGEGGSDLGGGPEEFGFEGVGGQCFINRFFSFLYKTAGELGGGEGVEGVGGGADGGVLGEEGEGEGGVLGGEEVGGVPEHGFGVFF